MPGILYIKCGSLLYNDSTNKAAVYIFPRQVPQKGFPVLWIAHFSLVGYPMHFHGLLLEGPVTDGMAVFVQGPGCVQSMSILINVIAVYFDFHGCGLLGLVAPVHSARRLFVRRQVRVDLIQGEVAIAAACQQGFGPRKEAVDGFRFQVILQRMPEIRCEIRCQAFCAPSLGRYQGRLISLIVVKPFIHRLEAIGSHECFDIIFGRWRSFQKRMCGHDGRAFCRVFVLHYG